MLKLSCRVQALAHQRPVVSRRRRSSVACCSPASIPFVLSERSGSGSVEAIGDRSDRLGLSYKEKFIVRCYEVGINKTATVETIANLLQEVGCNHIHSFEIPTEGFGTTLTMKRLHLIWVTSRMHIEMYKYPAWGGVIEIETWGQSEGRIGIRRDFILRDCGSGEVIGRATGLAFPEENHSSLRKIPKLEEPALYSRLGLTPRRSDLDMNQHVNHVAYIGWVMESMPQEIIETHELHAITLDYRMECQQDDIIESLTSPEQDPRELNGYAGTKGSEQDHLWFLHVLRLSSNGLEINKGRTEWRKKKPDR